MSDNTPAQRFLDALGIGELRKHRTLRGRPGDPHAPGDPLGYRSALPPHKERGGHPGVLPSQKPHGFRGLDTQGSVQTLMILLRKAARMFKDDSINDWNEMLAWTEEEVWNEGARVFGGADRVRELIDSLPERSAGENLNIDDVPENLLEQFYRGTKDETSGPAKPKNTREKPEKDEEVPQLSEESVRNFLEREELEVDDIVRMLEQLEREGGKFYNPELGRYAWDWVMDEYNFGDLTDKERERFHELNHEQKVALLAELSKGKAFKDIDFQALEV